jgi:predicted GNAT superfamily acetyltransferase
LYLDLFERVRSTGVETICCEVNFVPPNPDSKAFHARMGFNEAGRAERTRVKVMVGVGLAALAPAWEK